MWCWSRCSDNLNDIAVVVETNAIVLVWKTLAITSIVSYMLYLKSDAAIIVKSFPSSIRPEYVRSILLWLVPSLSTFIVSGWPSGSIGWWTKVLFLRCQWFSPRGLQQHCVRLQYVRIWLETFCFFAGIGSYAQHAMHFQDSSASRTWTWRISRPPSRCPGSLDYIFFYEKYRIG